MAERFKCAVAVHLFLLRADTILLLRRANTGYADGQYSVVAGHLDGNESVYAAIQREATEEAGIHIALPDLTVVGVMHRNAETATDREGIDFFLTARQWSGTVRNTEPAKCDDLSWFALDHLPPNTVPYVRQAISNFQAGIFFDTLGW